MKPGDSRERIELLLGLPDLHFPGHSNSSDMRKAGLWYYAGVQFSFFDLENDVLGDVGFKPFYLKPGQYREPETEHTQLDLWLFADEAEPNVQDLRSALSLEQIPFQDTGLESVQFNQATKKYEIIPHDPQAEESFGTLVLQSGIQIRYTDQGEIIRVQIGGKGWGVEGKEQHIVW